MGEVEPDDTGSSGEPVEIDRAGLEVLTEAQCLALLASVPVGRIVFTERALPAVQPVNFVVDNHSVIIRTMPGSKMAAAVQGAVVAFEVDDFDAGSQSGWNVTAIGQALLVTDPGERNWLAGLPLRPWAPGQRDHLIRIRIELLQGRRLRPRSRPR